MKNYFKVLFFISILVAVDLLTKYMFFNVHLGNSLPIITPVLNKGVVRWISIFPFYFMVFVSCIFLLWVLYFWIKWKLNSYIFVLLMSGVVWNLIDRVYYGWVRDFIDLHFWPIFNFADIYISAVILIFVKDILVFKK